MPRNLKGEKLNGKFRGIRKRRLSDGKTIYTARVVIRMGRSKVEHYPTAETPDEVLDLIEIIKAKKVLGQIPTRGTIEKMVKVMKRLATDLNHTAGPNLFLSEIEEFFGPNTQLSSINETSILDWKNHIDNQARRSHGPGLLSASSKNNRLKQLKKMLRLGKEWGLVARVPRIRYYKDFGIRDYNLDVPKFRALQGAMPSPPYPHKAILEYCLLTGKRSKDLLTTTKSEISQEKAVYRSSKNGKLLALTIPLFLTTLLGDLFSNQTDLQKDSEFLFANPWTGQPYNGIRTALKNASESAGIDPITLHMVRHLAADCWARATGNPIRVKEIMGWCDVEMVYRYTHLDRVPEEEFLRFESLLGAEKINQPEPPNPDNVVPFRKASNS